jgi:hypothetical protein
MSVKNGKIVLLKGQVTVYIVDINDVPIAFEGHAPFNIQNAMTAAGSRSTTFGRGFCPSIQYRRRCQTDYGHNVAALKGKRSFQDAVKPNQAV